MLSGVNFYILNASSTADITRGAAPSSLTLVH